MASLLFPAPARQIDRQRPFGAGLFDDDDQDDRDDLADDQDDREEAEGLDDDGDADQSDASTWPAWTDRVRYTAERPMGLVAWIEAEAARYRRIGTAAGDLIADQIEWTAMILRECGDKTPRQAELSLRLYFGHTRTPAEARS